MLTRLIDSLYSSFAGSRICGRAVRAVTLRQQRAACPSAARRSAHLDREHFL